MEEVLGLKNKKQKKLQYYLLHMKYLLVEVHWADLKKVYESAVLLGTLKISEKRHLPQ